jgi:RNA polymerase sigma-70 factor (ECF subfamily)
MSPTLVCAPAPSRALSATETCHPEDAALLSRLREGDEAAYRTLVVTHGPRMLAVARRYLSSEEDAEDAVQSAFLLVFRFVDKFEGGSRLSTWLHRIVVNSALMKIRSRRAHPEAPLNVSDFHDGTIPEPATPMLLSPSDQMVREETHHRLLGAVERLPAELRAAARLHGLAGLTFTEAARVLGRSRARVRAAFDGARLALRSLLVPPVPVPVPVPA